MVGLLVRSCEASEDEDVLVGDLVETTAFKADPVRVLLDAKVQGLPVLASADVVFLDQVCALSTVKAGDDVESLIVESDSSVEVSAGVQASNLSPCVTRDVVHLTFVHRLTWERASNRVDL